MRNWRHPGWRRSAPGQNLIRFRWIALLLPSQLLVRIAELFAHRAVVSEGSVILTYVRMTKRLLDESGSGEFHRRVRHPDANQDLNRASAGRYRSAEIRRYR